VSDAVATGPGWTLALGDCIAGMRELADLSVDVTITDPPYEAEAHTLQRRQKGSRTRPGQPDCFREVEDAALNFVPITAQQRTDVAAQIGRVTRHCAVVFCQVEAVTAWRIALEAGGMRYRRAIPWIKPDAMPSLHGRWPGQAFETIVIATKPGARPCPIGGKAIAYSFTREKVGQGAENKAPHPTTKPQALMRALVEHYSLPGDTILDCFTGSGSTGIAALALGRKFIGFELDANYHAIACRRLRGDEAKPRKEQPGLFDALGALP
jgi:site-specific DNA-methyltransferase (adenine-specific)